MFDRIVTTALCACLVSAAGCQGAPASRAQPVADSVREFSGTQGLHGWTYGYWDRSADADGAYDPSVDFRSLEHFGDDPINGLSHHAEFETGRLWSLEDGVYYTSLWAAGGHAHSALDLGSYARAEHWVVRRWTSATAGSLTITGHAGKVMPWGANWGGGVLAVIVVDGAELFRADVGERGRDYAVDAAVAVGSRVDFLIGPHPAIGVVEFTATIRPTLDVVR